MTWTWLTAFQGFSFSPHHQCLCLMCILSSHFLQAFKPNIDLHCVMWRMKAKYKSDIFFFLLVFLGIHMSLPPETVRNKATSVPRYCSFMKYLFTHTKTLLFYSYLMERLCKEVFCLKKTFEPSLHWFILRPAEQNSWIFAIQIS